MPVGLDLGFSYLGLVLLFVVPVVALVLRRKWQLAVERNEEIRRLLVLAAEEAAEAEAEFKGSPYVGLAAPISRPLEYECALCFSPTRTRCARCKAVRYCSGKCQILHWRQGHKEECRLFTFPDRSDDVRGGSSQKVLKQVEDEIDGDNFEIEREQYAKSVKHVEEEPVCVKSKFAQKIPRGSNGNAVDWCTDGKGTDTSSHGAEIPDHHHSIGVSPVKLENSCANVMGKNEKLSPKHTTLSGPADNLINSGKLHPIKPNLARDNLQVGSLDFLTSANHGAHESPLFGHSTQEEGFWEEPRSSSQPHLNKTGDCGKMLNSRSSLFSVNSYACSDVRDSSSTAVQCNGVQSNIKKPIGIVSPSKEMREKVASEGSLPRDSPIWRSEDGEYTSSGAYANQRQRTERPSVATHDSKVSVQSLSSERTNHLDSGRSTTPHSLASKECASLSCDDSIAHLSTHSKEHPLPCGKTKFSPTVVARSSDNATYSPNAGNSLKASPLKVVDQLKATKSQQHCQPGGGSEISGRYNYKGLFPYDLFVKLYNWSKIELQPCGLTNCGNSCYANAVLQCLACTQPLTAYFLQGLHSKACQRKEWCFTCEFENLILKAKEGASPLSPTRILSHIQNGGSHLRRGKEEDAHEFLRYAIDRMQSNCLNDARVDTARSLEEETTLIGLTFGGYLRSKIKCMNCRGKSDRCERMMDLTVEIDGDIRTLEEALRQFTRTEILDGENKYHCSRCGSYERAKKKFTVLEAPNILTIALKRFQSGKFGKLNKSVRFPEILDLAPYMSGTNDKSPIYRLYGVVVHLDIMNAAFSGHYVCYVKNVQNKWFQIDDSTVKAVDLGSVLTKDAYMLFYARCSPRAPRLIRNSTVPCDPQRPKHSPFNLRPHPAGGPWNASTELPYPNPTSLHHHMRTILEEGSLSDNSSAIFSEGCSSSDSTSTDDCVDPFLGDVGRNWRNSSDSDSSSSSSSSPSPPPCWYSRHSPLGEADRYSSSQHPETTKSHIDDGGWDFWHRPMPSRSGGKSSVPFLCSDSSKHCTNIVGRTSCSDSRISCRDSSDSDRLGLADKPVDSNNSGVSFRKSNKERTN